jgi:hypothetical protein
MAAWIVFHGKGYYIWQQIHKTPGVLDAKRLLIVLLLFFLTNGQGYGQYFSPDAEISLVTCSPGSELYSVFGHSAIRVKDTTTNRDLIFNYGVFDFSTPNFYWKFVRGKLKYQLAIQRMDDFVASYKAEGRSVKVEKMRLTQGEKRRMLQFLRVNYLPENRYYLYDFFYNNCSTKIWDVTQKEVSGGLSFDTSVYEPTSFRNLLYPYLEPVPWSKLGIDLLLGVPADQIATFEEQMYLPDYLSRNMGHTLKEYPLEGSRQLLAPERVVVERGASVSLFDSTPAATPVIVFSGLLLAIVAISLAGSRQLKRWFDIVLLLLTSLLGVVLLFMWFGSDHQQMDWNLNVMWANPLGLVFIFYALRNRLRQAARVYGILLVFLIVNLLFWHWLPQQFNVSLIPLVIGLTLRGTDNLLYVCCPRYRMEKWIRLSRAKT